MRLAVFLVSLVAVASTARAQPNPSDEGESNYRHNRLVVDVMTLATASLSVVLYEHCDRRAGSASPGCELGAGAMVATTGLYFFGQTFVHFRELEIGRGLGSIGIRAGLPLALGTVAYQLDPDSTPYVVIGAMGGSMLLEWVLFSDRDDSEPKQASWAPVAAPTRGGATVGLASWF